MYGCLSVCLYMYYFFSRIAAKSWLASFKSWRKPVKTIVLPQVTGNFLTCPGRYSNVCMYVFVYV